MGFKPISGVLETTTCNGTNQVYRNLFSEKILPIRRDEDTTVSVIFSSRKEWRFESSPGSCLSLRGPRSFNSRHLPPCHHLRNQSHMNFRWRAVRWFDIKIESVGLSPQGGGPNLANDFKDFCARLLTNTECFFSETIVAK